MIAFSLCIWFFHLSLWCYLEIYGDNRYNGRFIFQVGFCHKSSCPPVNQLLSTYLFRVLIPMSEVICTRCIFYDVCRKDESPNQSEGMSPAVSGVSNSVQHTTQQPPATTAPGPMAAPGNRPVGPPLMPPGGPPGPMPMHGNMPPPMRPPFQGPPPGMGMMMVRFHVWFCFCLRNINTGMFFF